MKIPLLMAALVALGFVSALTGLAIYNHTHLRVLHVWAGVDELTCPVPTSMNQLVTCDLVRAPFPYAPPPALEECLQGICLLDPREAENLRNADVADWMRMKGVHVAIMDAAKGGSK